MKNINANERGRAAYGKGRTRQPMDDAQFVKLMYAEVDESDEIPRTVIAYYILEWKGGWDEAKTHNTKPVASKKASKVKKKAKKKSRKKAKK